MPGLFVLFLRNSNSWSRRHRPDCTPPSKRRSSHDRLKSRRSPTQQEDRRRGRPGPAPSPVKNATPSQTPETQQPPPQSIPRLGGHQPHPPPGYPTSQAPGPMPHPNYPPPGYDQYGNYMPYMGQHWPMYPPHHMGSGILPPQGPPHGPHGEFSSPYLKVIETVSAEDTKNTKKQDKKCN